MNYEEEINILKRAGFFQDGDDAVSLIAAFEAMQIELEQLRSALTTEQEPHGLSLRPHTERKQQ